MGGGPSREEREAQRRLEQQQRSAGERADRLVTLAERPNPLTERLNARTMGVLDWVDRTGAHAGTPRNVENMPGLAPHLDIFGQAARRQAGERLGRGALSLGQDQQNPEIAARIREQQDAERQQQAAGNLEGAVRANMAEATGSVLPLAGYDTNKALSLANMAMGGQQNATSNYLQFLTRPRRPGIFSQIMGGLTQIGAGAASNPALMAALKKGGRWDKYIGKPVEVGEEGEEVLVTDDGDVQPLKPGVVVPQKPGIVIPADRLPSYNPPQKTAAYPSYNPPATRPRRVADDSPQEFPSYTPPAQRARRVSQPEVLTAKDAATVPEQSQPNYNPQRRGAPLRSAYPDTPEGAREYEAAMRAYRPQNNNSRLKSALIGIGRGLLTGGIPGAIFGGVSHGVDPSMDEKVHHQYALPASAAGTKAAYERAADDAQLKNIEADTANKLAQPGLKEKEIAARARREGAMALDRERARLLQLYKTKGSFKRDVDVELAREADRLGVTLVDYDRTQKAPQRFQHMGQWFEYVEDETTGDYYARPVMGYPTYNPTATRPAPAALPVDASKVPNAQGLLPNQVATDEDRDAARRQREQLAAQSRAMRERLAAQSRAMQQDRNNLSREKFRQRYPGAGKKLTMAAIQRRAEQLEMSAGLALEEAIKQGYEIEQ